MADNVVQIIIRVKDEAGKAIAETDKGLQKLGLSAKGIAAGVVGATAALGAATFAMKAFGDVVRDGANIGDQLNKVSEQTGLTVEQVSRLKYAADQNESSLEAMSSAVKFLSKNLYEAQQGGSEQVETLKALGFTGEEASGHLGSTGEALEKVADKLKGIPDPGTRSALAMRLLGRGAIEALPLLQQGSGALKKYGDEADRLGITVSTTAGKLGDDFNDALSRVNAQFDGLKTKVAEAALPAFITLVDSASDAVAQLATTIQENKDAIKLFADILARAGTVAIKITVAGLDALKQAADLINPFLELQKAGEASQDREDRRSLSFRQTIATGQKDAAGRDVFRQEIPTIEGVGVTSTALPKKKQEVELTEQQKAAIQKAREEQEKFNTALDRAYLISERLGKSLKDALGTKAATTVLPDIEKAVEVPVKLVLPKDEKGADLTAAQAAAKSFNDDLVAAAEKMASLPEPEIAPAFTAADSAAAAFDETLEMMGLNVEQLRDQAVALGVDLQGLGGVGIIAGAQMEKAFSTIFDPVLGSAQDVGQAVGNLKGTFDDAFSSLGNAIINGQTGMLKLSNVIDGATRAMKRLIVELTLAIIKALILKAIGGFIGLSSGGTIVDSNVNPDTYGAKTGGQVLPAFSGGGSIFTSAARAFPSFAAGGGLAAALVASPMIPHYSVGAFRSVPGSAQAYDSVLSALAPGEVVLPTVGGMNPGQVVAKLAALEHRLEAPRARASTPAQAGPLIENLHLHAFDWQSIRNQTRRGQLDKELGRAFDLGRGEA